MSYELLTAREKEIVDLVMSGLYVAEGRDYRKELGRQLGISESTVAKHCWRIYAIYRIDLSKFRGMVRLVYLRAKELGLI